MAGRRSHQTRRVLFIFVHHPPSSYTKHVREATPSPLSDPCDSLLLLVVAPAGSLLSHPSFCAFPSDKVVERVVQLLSDEREPALVCRREASKRAAAKDLKIGGQPISRTQTRKTKRFRRPSLPETSKARTLSRVQTNGGYETHHHPLVADRLHSTPLRRRRDGAGRVGARRTALLLTEARRLSCAEKSKDKPATRLEVVGEIFKEFLPSRVER